MNTNHPIDESARLDALHSYQILDTDPESIFDDFTFLAAHICDTPISLISLLDDQRQWFKSRVGLGAQETPREFAFCAHALETAPSLLIVEDATRDQRFVDNPLVTGNPNIRFYAGSPLVTPSQQALGTLCVIDSKPRVLTEDQLSCLQALSRQVVAQLESRRNGLRLEKAAQENERQRQELQLILDHVPAYVFYKDTANNILRVNKAVAKSLGCETADIEGKATSEIYPDHADDFYRDDLEVLKSQQPKLGIIESKTVVGGGSRWVSTDKIPISSGGKEIDGILAIATDITDLRQSEQSLREAQRQLEGANDRLEREVARKTAELKESTRRFEDLFHNAPDMFASTNPSTGCLVECNATMLRRLGYRRDELIGKPVNKLFHPSCEHKVQGMFQEFKTKGRLENSEVTFAHKDGSRVEVSLSSTAIYNQQGEVIASRTVCREITEKKRLQEESQQRLEQLTHLSRVATASEMATGLAHEINQPLYAIKNYASGALRVLQNKNGDLDSLEPVLVNIKADADRAADLILSLRRFIQPHGSQRALVAPNAIVARSVELLPASYRRNGVTVAISANDNLANIECDEIQIEQVLVNLLLNAAEAVLSAGGSDKVIRVQVSQHGPHSIEFSITDTGPGIAEPLAEKIFDAFYTTKEKGLGMGLAICRTIVEAHQGDITATANTPSGAKVSFRLPIGQEGGSLSREP